MRKFFLPSFVILVSLVLLIRLLYLQVFDESLKLQSETNSRKVIYEFPERGYIYDRNGKLLVANQPAYDIMVVPREIKHLDTLEFCSLLNITLDQFNKRLKRAKNYSYRTASIFYPQLTKQEYAPFQEKERKFQGFYTQKRAIRSYLVNDCANIFGYINEVTTAELKKDNHYMSGDLIGKQGVEKQYETVLRGKKGVKYYLRDKFNRIIASFKDGKYDTLPVQGADLTLTIDYQLQHYGTELMTNKRGGIVAIEPKTGEILALITAPSFDPSLLVGRNSSKNYYTLYKDSISKPLYDRSLLAQYPPGSPFKILTGLIGLEQGVITSRTPFKCQFGFRYGRAAFMKCHDQGISRLNNGIYNSCNTYFANVYRKIIDQNSDVKKQMNLWSTHVKSFGLGNFLGTDFPIGAKGHIPNAAYYDRYYPSGRWGSTTTISNAIGQGEVLTTPIQLANMMAAIANRGFFYTPHIVKHIKGVALDTIYTIPKYTSISKKHFKPVIEGLADVYTKGTARGLQVEGIQICGKTGTAENKIRVNGITHQLIDHSTFVAFAPKDDPKIVVAVFVENGHWGNKWAGPIATLMIEKYLNSKVSRVDLEKNMLEGSIMPTYKEIEQLILEQNKNHLINDSP